MPTENLQDVSHVGETTASQELVELMVGYQTGSEACFDQLYDRLLSPLRGYLISLTRDGDRASDLLQEAFLQLHRSRRTYRSPRSVKAWAFGIARNVFLMSRRTAWRRREVQLSERRPVDIAVPSEAGRIIAGDLLQEAIVKLSPEQREAFLLHHLWGFSFAEIAGIAGISTTSAKVRSYRGAKKLRATIDSKPGASASEPMSEVRQDYL